MDLAERGDAVSRHPWEVERFRAYRSVLSDHGALGCRSVLDVGAGDGWFGHELLPDLPDDVRVVQWDINYTSDELVSPDPRISRVIERPSQHFELALLLDVLEHIEEPGDFIAGELGAVLRPGAAVLVAVPAHPWLFSDHDRHLGHYRRYRRPELDELLGDWLHIVDRGSLFASLVAPRAAAVAVERLRSRLSAPDDAPDDANEDANEASDFGVGGWSHGPALTRAVSGVLRADVRLGRRVRVGSRRLPGLSNWVYGTVR